jgi:hypothetical protein
MPARKRPTPEDTVTARRVLLDGLARDAGIFQLVSELAPLHPRDNTFPGEVFVVVAADALDWCRVRRADPLRLGLSDGGAADHNGGSRALAAVLPVPGEWRGVSAISSVRQLSAVRPGC